MLNAPVRRSLPYHPVYPLALVVGAIAAGAATAQAQGLNVADPKKHPYADTAQGRDGYTLSGATVNEARLYDFYARQADHYMAQPTVPELLPAYPGLDGNQHGHWGKHNQNNYNDPRWEKMNVGTVFAANNKGVVKSVNLQLGVKRSVFAMFDPLALSYRSIWSGAFLEFHGFRWGLSRGQNQNGPTMVEGDGKFAWSHSGPWQYRGYYLHGDRGVFAYRLGKTDVLDHPWADGDVFTRTLEFGSGAESLKTRVAHFKAARPVEGGKLPAGVRVFAEKDTRFVAAIRTEGATASWEHEGGWLSLKLDAAKAGGRVKMHLWSGPAKELDRVLKAVASSGPIQKLGGLTRGGPARWPKKLTVTGTRAADDAPYVIDTIPVPFENPHQAMMLLSGLDFLPNGDALICTLMGDVWKVSGLDDGLKKVTWKRFAAGLNQPFGVKVSGGRIFVLCRNQISILHDLNGDDEADFVENYANDFGGYNKSHTHVFGLDHDPAGDFFYVVREDIFRTPYDGSGTKLWAQGVRNCMGYGMRKDGLLVIAPQEGTWTPTSMIIEVREGEFYGANAPRSKKPISPPLCYVPRGIDNSTGGMVFAESDGRWGPLEGQMVTLSYGYGSWYYVLRDETVERPQGASVPMAGEFTSGVVRGRFRPADGQLYVVGCEGWGNYAVEDGCFNRIRYTGRKLYKPIGFRVHSNGIRVDFTQPLDAKTAADAKRYLAQMWNYEYAKRYGSPEFSVRQPSKLGHDLLKIRSVKVLDGGRSIFLEIPDIVPAMQVYVRMHLKAADGTAFKADLFPTVLELGKRFDADGLAAGAPGRATHLALRVKDVADAAVPPISKKPDANIDRKITIKAIGGLKFDTERFTVKAGQWVQLDLKNTDVMPHNLVIVTPGSYKKVGEESFKMLNDPRSAEKQYVPDTPEVLAFTHLVGPNETYTLYFKAPMTKGEHPYLCTFPGHWMVMKGVMVVE